MGANHVHGDMRRVSACDLVRVEKPPRWLRGPSKGFVYWGYVLNLYVVDYFMRGVQIRWRDSVSLDMSMLGVE